MRWRRRRTEVGGRSPTQQELGLAPEDSWGDGLARELERLRAAVTDRDEPSLWSLLVAANEIAGEWLESCDRVAAARSALATAEQDEAAIGKRLRSLVEVLRAALEMPDAPASLRATSEAPTAEIPDSDASDIDAHRPVAAAAPTAAQPPIEDDTEAIDRVTGEIGDGLAPPSNGLAIFLFGSVRIVLDGAPVDLCVHGKALRLFRYLLAHRAQAIPKDVLIEMLWPDAGVDNGRRGLHQAVYTIRKSLRGADPEGHLIVFEDDAYRINPVLATWCDVEEFERLVELAQQAEAADDERRARALLRRAEELWTADYAEDAPYEDWALAERERLRLMYVDAIKRLGEMYEGTGHIPDAIDASHRALAVEPCDEESHRRIMRCQAVAGNRYLAVRQYRACVEQLDRGFGLEPSTQTVELYESLLDPPSGAH